MAAIKVAPLIHLTEPCKNRRLAANFGHFAPIASMQKSPLKARIALGYRMDVR
jgi:hypothetical protein